MDEYIAVRYCPVCSEQGRAQYHAYRIECLGCGRFFCHSHIHNHCCNEKYLREPEDPWTGFHDPSDYFANDLIMHFKERVERGEL